MGFIEKPSNRCLASCQQGATFIRPNASPIDRIRKRDSRIVDVFFLYFSLFRKRRKKAVIAALDLRKT